MNKQSLSFLCGICLAFSAAAAPPEHGPFDAKAREIFQKVIAIPTSIGNDKVPEMAEYLASEFRAAGFADADINILPLNYPDDKTASLVVRYRSEAKVSDGKSAKPILLLAHMDVVAAKRADWQRDPFRLIEEGGYFFGRGAYDVKPGVVALTTAFLRLKKEGFKPKRDLIIYFSGDEESSQRTTVDVVRDHRDLIDAEYALNSDAGGGSLDEVTGKPALYKLSSAEKTYADFTLTTHNAGGHSSRPRVDNAIYDLAEALLKVSKYRFPAMSNDATIANFRAAAKTNAGELGAAMARFAANPQDTAAADIIAESPAYIGQTRTTCIATMLAGGHAMNALPQSASANVNCRIFPGVKVPDVQAKLQELAGPAVEIKVVGTPMSSDASPLRKDVVDAVTRAVQKVRPGVPVVPQQDSGASDGLVFRAAGIPTYGTEAIFIKPSEDFAHGLNERIPVESFYKSLEQWYLLIKDVGGTATK